MPASTKRTLTALAAITAVIATTPVSPAAAANARTTQTTCADVLFLGARGSSEPGPGTPGWKPVTSDPYGLGRPVNSAYADLMAQLGPQRTVFVVSLRYAATSALTLAADRKRYFRNLTLGITRAIADLTRQATACPDQDLVLAGFSQGAIVMHRVLHELAARKADAAILSRVVAAILIGDGDQVPDDNEVRFGSAPLKAHGVGEAFPKISGTSTAKFSAALGPGIASVCDNHDLVCDWMACDENPVSFAAGLYVHLHYPGSTPVGDAAAWAAKRLLAIPAP
jgi:hypothetical protein